mmetsp:Transcript_7790/g.19909  ORF Transcript_7790/g.19909 Transcript_7790/m.19909 type:complete len:480 (-) Transcript_7790:107-1546(-)
MKGSRAAGGNAPRKNSVSFSADATGIPPAMDNNNTSFDNPGKRRMSGGRMATFNRIHSGLELSSITSQLRPGSEPNLSKLRSLILDDSAVVPLPDLTPVQVIGEGGFGVVWQCSYSKAAKGTRAESYVADGHGYVALKQRKILIEEGAATAEPPPAGRRGNGRVAAAPPERREDGAANALDARALASFSAELLMLKSLFHPNVIGYIGCTVREGDDGLDEIAIVQEFAPHGTLKPLINEKNFLVRSYSIADGLRWAQHVALGMAFLHDCKPPIIHRDLKPENILLCGPRCAAKIADFGLVTFEGQGNVALGGNFQHTGMVGSMRYMAPENYRGESYSRKTDVHSFGIILYELLTRSRAYEGLYMGAEAIADAVALRGLRPPLPAGWPDDAKHLAEACWDPNPNSRLEFKEVAAELTSWRNDTADRVLIGITRASAKPLAEYFGYFKCWGKHFADRHSMPGVVSRKESVAPDGGMRRRPD